MTDKKDDKKIRIEIMPGAFDSFDGTQEELDELMVEINRLAESGELMEMSEPIDLDNLDDEDTAMLAAIAEHFGDMGADSISFEEDIEAATAERKKKLN